MCQKQAEIQVFKQIMCSPYEQNLYHHQNHHTNYKRYVHLLPTICACTYFSITSKLVGNKVKSSSDFRTSFGMTLRLWGSTYHQYSNAFLLSIDKNKMYINKRKKRETGKKGIKCKTLAKVYLHWPE